MKSFKEYYLSLSEDFEARKTLYHDLAFKKEEEEFKKYAEEEIQKYEKGLKSKNPFVVARAAKDLKSFKDFHGPYLNPKQNTTVDTVNAEEDIKKTAYVKDAYSRKVSTELLDLWNIKTLNQFNRAETSLKKDISRRLQKDGVDKYDIGDLEERIYTYAKEKVLSTARRQNIELKKIEFNQENKDKKFFMDPDWADIITRGKKEDEAAAREEVGLDQDQPLTKPRPSFRERVKERLTDIAVGRKINSKKEIQSEEDIETEKIDDDEKLSDQIMNADSIYREKKARERKAEDERKEKELNKISNQIRIMYNLESQEDFVKLLNIFDTKFGKNKWEEDSTSRIKLHPQIKDFAKKYYNEDRDFTEKELSFIITMIKNKMPR